MKRYFANDYKNYQGSLHEDIKWMYDRADEIFDQRFDQQEQNTEQKNITKEDSLRDLVDKAIAWTEAQTAAEAKRMGNLVIGKTYLRLALCQQEAFKPAGDSFKIAARYLEQYYNPASADEIDILLMLDKAKYLKYTTGYGDKERYKMAYTGFMDVARNVIDSTLTPEKRLHLLLDVKVNMGRVKRYMGEYDAALCIFMSVYATLQKALSTECAQVKECTPFMGLFCDNVHKPDAELETCMIGQQDAPFLKEYLLQVLIHVGIILRKRRQYEQAKEIFDLVNRIDTQGGGHENVDAKNNIAVCLRKMYWTAKRDEPQADIVLLKDAINICSELKDRGNRFATVNLYKCRLLENGDDKATIKQLEESLNDTNCSNEPLRFLLGRFYEKSGDYEKAMNYYRQICQEDRVIVKGSLGFKVQYRLAECYLRKEDYREAERVLSVIRAELKKNNKEEPSKLDITTEIGYGWCLMREGRHSEAAVVYESAKQYIIQYAQDAQAAISESETEDKKSEKRLYNNLADCYIHMAPGVVPKGKPGEGKDYFAYAEECLNAVPEGKHDWYTIYLRATLQLKRIIHNDSQNTCSIKGVLEQYSKVLWLTPMHVGANSGWLISAVMLYEKSRDEKILNDITLRLRNSIVPFSLKAYTWLAGLFLSNEYSNIRTEALCEAFCSANLVNSAVTEHTGTSVDEQESFHKSKWIVDPTVIEEQPWCHKANEAFRRLMKSESITCIAVQDRAYMFACVIKVYECVLKIKQLLRCKADDLKTRPSHYTKIRNLKSLFGKEKDGDGPRFRMWSSVYMNDWYEGVAFGDIVMDVAGNNSKAISEEDASQLWSTYFSDKDREKLIAESDVYISSFTISKEESYPMWSVYGDRGSGCRLTFARDFVDIGGDCEDIILDEAYNDCALYKVLYIKDSEDNKTLKDAEKWVLEILIYLQKLEKVLTSAMNNN